MSLTSEKELPKMQYVRLGNTGMKVSKICLGCMGFGSKKWQQWVMEEDESLDMLKKAYDAGINFFDTANAYSSGESERILGKAIKKFNFSRSKIVIATKVFVAFVDGQHELLLVGKNPEEYGLINQGGLSRKHIFEAVEASLKRLQLDYIDLYQIHRLDRSTSGEEIMEALHDLVKAGKIRYIGASSMHAWEFQKLNNIAEKNGWTKFVSMQNLYNLIHREEEREMMPYCLDAGVGMIPWSPLARGVLTRRPEDKTLRGETDFGKRLMVLSDADRKVINRVWDIAEKYNATASQVALAWCWSKPVVSAPIVGITKQQHLEDLVLALNVKLTEEDIKYLEEEYQPKTTFM